MELLEELNLANKELRKVLGKEVKVVGRSHCCGSCTIAEIEGEGYKNYIAWRIYTTGMNKNIEEYKEGEKEEVYADWKLTEEQLDKAIEVLSCYFEVNHPKTTESICIR